MIMQTALYCIDLILPLAKQMMIVDCVLAQDSVSCDIRLRIVFATTCNLDRQSDNFWSENKR